MVGSGWDFVFCVVLSVRHRAWGAHLLLFSPSFSFFPFFPFFSLASIYHIIIGGGLGVSPGVVIGSVRAPIVLDPCVSNVTNRLAPCFVQGVGCCGIEGSGPVSGRDAANRLS